jgi:hypothetical protein
MNVGAVNDSLLFAQKRLDELKKLNGGNLAGVKSEDRQILIQEFFFHLVSAIDILVQAINKSKLLRIPDSQISLKKVCDMPGQVDPIKPLIASLHPDTRHNGQWIPLPQNPYSEEGSHFRILVFRHWVSHYGENPFVIRWGGDEPHISLFLDPRYPNLGGSKLPALDELEAFWSLVNDKCQQVIEILKATAS